FASDDERELLEGFSAMLQQYYKDPAKCYLCGHNIKEFDIPYVCRRMVVNGLSFPEVLQITGKKPWETKHLLDTLELWKFGDYKNYTSLKLLAGLFGIPSPKDDIDGSDVGRVYWQEKDLPRIALYCEKDVLATVQLFLRYQLKPLLEEDQIEYIDRGAGEEE
ncbi:MAG: ribonuclease H-like domain-containing protein, partial [Saprospiraceae bacterium]